MLIVVGLVKVNKRCTVGENGQSGRRNATSSEFQVARPPKNSLGRDFMILVPETFFSALDISCRSIDLSTTKF